MKKTRLFLLLSFLLCLLAFTACADTQTTAPDTTEAVGTTVDPLADFTVETVRDDFYLNVDYAPPVELFQDTASFQAYAEQALFPYENLEEYAKLILDEAVKNAKTSDDMSVVIIKIEEV